MYTIDSTIAEVRDSILHRDLSIPIKKPIKYILRKRKFHCYCVGTAKSGTHSIANLLKANYRSAHEPAAQQLIALKHLYNNREIKGNELKRFLKDRDYLLWLEMESSDFAGYFAKELHEIFPESKFILTIRDCFSFLDSIINHQKNNPVDGSDIWKLGRDLNYGKYITPMSSSEPDNIDYPITGYMSYWAKRNKTIINDIPEDKLLIIKTKSISDSTKILSDFLEIPTSTITTEKSHSFPAKKKWNMLKMFNPDIIDEIAEKTGCMEIMRKFFPKISSIRDTSLLS